MKKLLLTIIIIFTFGLCVNAQSDGFFGNWDEGCGDRLSGGTLSMPQNPIGTIANETVDAPLGSGLIMLSALGVGYLLTKKREK